MIVASTALGFGLYAAVFLTSSRASSAQQALPREFDAAAMALVAGLSDRPAGLTELLGIHEDDEENRAELRRFDEELEPGVYRIMRAAASNAAKYATRGSGVLRRELGDE